MDGSNRWFKTPAERNRNAFLAFGALHLLLVITITNWLPTWAFLPLMAAMFVGMVTVLTIVFKRKLAAADERQGRDAIWGHWPPEMSAPSSPAGQRRGHIVKAGRFYVVAFTPTAVLISPRIDSRRDAERWLNDYVTGTEVNVEHEIDLDSIEGVVVNEATTVEIITATTTYTLESWFNSFSGSHHGELRAIVEELDMIPGTDGARRFEFTRAAEPVDRLNSGASESRKMFRPGTGLLARDAVNRTVVSCGGGSNMFDFRH